MLTLHSTWRLAVALLLVCCFATTAHSAVELVVTENGLLAGANGVIVQGMSYDVRFRDSSCADLYSGCDEDSDFVFATDAAALAASQALLDSVLVDGPAGRFYTDLWRIAGCHNFGEHYDWCIVYTPFAGFADGPWADLDFHGIAYARVTTDSTLSTSGAALMFSDWANSYHIRDRGATLALWQVSAPLDVPEPTTLALLGLGLAGIGLSRRKQ